MPGNLKAERKDTKMIKALFFDAFRTLFDSHGTHIDATRTILARNGLDIDPDAFHNKWDEFILSGWKDGEFMLQWPMFEKCLAMTFEFFHVENYDTKKDIHCWLDMVAGAPVFPEVETTLAKLEEKYIIAIVSNTDNFEIGMCLERHPLPVRLVVSSEDARCYKPNKKIFNDALAAAGVKSSEAVMIGDSQFADVSGAFSAGIKSIWINRLGSKPRLDLPAPDAELPDLTDVPPVIDGFNNDQN